MHALHGLSAVPKLLGLKVRIMTIIGHREQPIVRVLALLTVAHSNNRDIELKTPIEPASHLISESHASCRTSAPRSAGPSNPHARSRSGIILNACPRYQAPTVTSLTVVLQPASTPCISRAPPVSILCNNTNPLFFSIQQRAKRSSSALRQASQPTARAAK